MADARYRGRRRTSAQRRAGHLRTTYTEDDLDAFARDLVYLRSVWPQSVRDADRGECRRQQLKRIGVVCLIAMLPVTAFLVWFVVDTGAPWWCLPVGQSLVLPFGLVRSGLFTHDDDTALLIRREAARRGVPCNARADLYRIMNQLNADYNSHLWNRTFKWK